MQLFLSSFPILLLLISLLLANCNLANGRENEEVDESMLIEQLHDSLLHSNPVNQHRLSPSPLSSSSSSDSDSEDLGSLSWNPESDSHPDGEEHYYKLPKLSDRIIQHLMNVQFSKQDVDDLKHLVKLEEAIKHSHNQAKTPRYCTCSSNAGRKEKSKSKLKRKKSKSSQQDKERKRPLIEVNVLPCGGNQQPTNATTSATQLVTIKSVVYQTHTTHKPTTTTSSSAEDETETITMTNTAEPATDMTKTETVTVVSLVTPIVPTATVTITERVTVTSTKSKTFVYVTVTKPTPTLSESSEVVMTVITPAL